MPPRRKRRSESTAARKQGRLLFAGISVLLLLVALGLIVPMARRKHIATSVGVGLALVVWLCGIATAWVCLQSSRRRRNSRGHITTHSDYGDDIDDDPPREIN